jgi:S-adenosylmethionine hydrolase
VIAMTDALITLTTDFGTGSPYVAAVKGVLLTLNPAARVIDLGHEIPPHDLRQAAFFLASTVPYFPAAALHVVVVDPGVGSERAILYVEVAGHRLLVPDNGCWTLLTEGSHHAPRVIRLADSHFWRANASPTFHGRDIFAPVAANLSLGLDPRQLGPHTSHWVKLAWPKPSHDESGISGEVVFVDHFGNLITNIPGPAVAELAGRSGCVQIGEATIRRCVRTYAEAEPGTPIVLVSSGGWLEVAVSNGSAARTLGAAVGTPVRVLMPSE